MLAPRTQTVLFLDEPEAFLHPPQARLLGEFLAKERPKGTQLFIATHSPDVLLGLLDAAPTKLRLLRMQYDGHVNHVKELNKNRVKEISADSLMKFSGVLSGTFHERVIICESDSDCTFYRAILDVPTVRGEQEPDVMFLHAGGKHRIAALAETLRDLNVPVAMVTDIDILNEETVLKRLIDALGGDWETISGAARALKTAIEQHKPWLNANEVAKGIGEVLTKTPASGEFPKNLRADIEAIFRKASPWDAVKDAGRAAIPAGQPTKHYNDLIGQCSALGLWIVPVGEVEGFCKAEGGHGPRWVQQVLSNYDLANAPELDEARKFVRSIWQSRLSNSEGAGADVVS